MDKVPGFRYLLSGDREWKTDPDGIRYVTFSTTPGDPASPLTVLSEIPANFREPPHKHGCNYTEIIIDGEMRVGKVDLSKGDVRVMQAGVGYGPLIAGPKGCTRLTIFDRADGSPMILLGKEAAARHA